MEQSAVPVLIFFFGSFCVAVLSRQFLRVVSAWRSESEDQKAGKLRAESGGVSGGKSEVKEVGMGQS